MVRSLVHIQICTEYSAAKQISTTLAQYTPTIVDLRGQCTDNSRRESYEDFLASCYTPRIFSFSSEREARTYAAQYTTDNLTLSNDTPDTIDSTTTYTKWVAAQQAHEARISQRDRAQANKRPISESSSSAPKKAKLGSSEPLFQPYTTSSQTPNPTSPGTIRLAEPSKLTPFMLAYLASKSLDAILSIKELNHEDPLDFPLNGVTLEHPSLCANELLNIVNIDFGPQTSGGCTHNLLTTRALLEALAQEAEAILPHMASLKTPLKNLRDALGTIPNPTTSLDKDASSILSDLCAALATVVKAFSKHHFLIEHESAMSSSPELYNYTLSCQLDGTVHLRPVEYKTDAFIRSAQGALYHLKARKPSQKRPVILDLVYVTPIGGPFSTTGDHQLYVRDPPSNGFGCVPLRHGHPLYHVPRELHDRHLVRYHLTAGPSSSPISQGRDRNFNIHASALERIRAASENRNKHCTTCHSCPVHGHGAV